MDIALRYFADFHSAFRDSLGVYPASLLDLVAFVVGVVGLEHIVLLGYRPPSPPPFLFHPPASLSYPKIPLFARLREKLLSAATASGPPTFMQFFLRLVDDLDLRKVLCRRRPLARTGNAFIVDPHAPTQGIRFLSEGECKSPPFKCT